MVTFYMTRDFLLLDKVAAEENERIAWARNVSSRLTLGMRRPIRLWDEVCDSWYRQLNDVGKHVQ
jgi:hypothetical protein